MPEEKKSVVPRLRFPEFRDAGPWEIKPLGKLLVSPPEYGINAPAVPYSEFLPTYLRITDIAGDGSGIRDEKVSVARNVSKENYLCEGDIVLARTGASVGKSYKHKKENGSLVFAGFLIRIRPNRDKLNDEFLYQYFFTEQYWRWVAHTSARSGQPGINSSEYASLPLPMPLLPPEQQKIADCLSSLDEVIDLEAQKLDALKAHKKGLMQQLFPREGETTPRLRFPEFQNAPEWDEQSIGDFGDVVTGSTPSTMRREFYGGGIPFVSPADISGLRFVDETKTTLTALGFDETRPIRANSVLFVCIGSTIGKVAQNRRECAANQQINSVIPNAEHSGAFVYYALVNNSDRIAELSGRQAVPIINKTLFSSVELPVPKLKEQERIATCLTSLDDLIAAQSAKLEALKAHKKGLMQQLFPQEVD